MSADTIYDCIGIKEAQQKLVKPDPGDFKLFIVQSYLQDFLEDITHFIL